MLLSEGAKCHSTKVTQIEISGPLLRIYVYYFDDFFLKAKTFISKNVTGRPITAASAYAINLCHPKVL